MTKKEKKRIRRIAREIAVELVRLEARRKHRRRTDRVATEITSEVAGWNGETARLLIAAHVGPQQAAVAFRNALRRTV